MSIIKGFKTLESGLLMCEICKTTFNSVRECKSHQEDEILNYAEHYHNPISDFKGFKELIKQNLDLTITKEDLVRLLGY